MRLIIITITTFIISSNIVTADTLIEQLKKCKQKVKNVYPEEYRDGGTHITTFTVGNYRFIMRQNNNNSENSGEIEKGHEFRFTAERKESKKGKYKPIQFFNLFQTGKVDEFNRVLQDSIEHYIQHQNTKPLLSIILQYKESMNVAISSPKKA